MKMALPDTLRQVLTFFTLGGTLLFSNCDSPLSDLEVTDPGLLQTHFVVERALLSNGTVVAGIQTTILDKNLAGVELKNGQVKVNGQQMSSGDLAGITFYYIPSPAVNLDSDYNFDVVLANGDSYGGAVTTPAKTFTSMTVPENPGIDEDLTVSWNDVYVHDDLIITLDLTSPAGTVPGASFTLTTAQMQQGSFTIPKSTFATPAGVTSVTIKITGTNYGTVDSKFRSGSAAISRMRIEKDVTFK